MDSITQAALGAAVAEAALGRKAGYRAALWGAIAGTIPDLDVLANPLLDEITQLSWHRGYSHSLLFVIAFSPLLAWVIGRIHRRQASWREWAGTVFLILFTHVFLDCFTVYGTQLFLPFSNYMVGFNTIAIIDPLYTIPLLLGIIVALFLKKVSRARRIVNYAGIMLSSLYLLMTVGIKYHVGNIVEQSLADNSIVYRRYMTAPTLFNAILWRATVEVTDGYWAGYYSLFDSDDDIDFRFIPRNGGDLIPMASSRAVKRLLWFSNGYFTVTQGCEAMEFHDLRFGEIHTDYSDSGQYVFSWQLVKERKGSTNRIVLKRVSFRGEKIEGAFSALWRRIKGT